MSTDPAATGAAAWSVVVPVKRLERAKTRLDLPSGDRVRLAAAMAGDTVAAALAAPSVTRVVVVTDDEVAAAAVRSLGADVVADEPAAGMNDALRHGIAVARRETAVAVATLSADLPALTGGALDAALARVRHAAVVADAARTGTTLLAAAAGVDVVPQYGEGSLARHVAAGAQDITGQVSQRLRLDVDTLADLAAAVALGTGPRTAAVAEDLHLVP